MVREAEALPEPRSQAARELLEFGARPANGGSSPPSLYLAVTPFLCLCLSGAEQVHARTQAAAALATAAAEAAVAAALEPLQMSLVRQGVV